MIKYDSYDYSKLLKPFWSPPAWLFGPVWASLYVLIAISFGKVFLMVIQQRISSIVILPFTLNLVFNLSFTPLRFGLKNNPWAVTDVILILSTLIWAIIIIYPYVRWVAYMQIPYLIWVSFAAILQITITYLNR
jgi:tryptophan-rich sensory protein